MMPDRSWRPFGITQVVREHMSRTAYITFLLFVWISLIYVIVAFADVTASSFARFESIPVVLSSGQTETFTLNGGSVAIGATAYLLLSIAMGLATRFTKIPWYAALTLCVGLLILTIAKAPDLANWLAGHGLPFLNTQGAEAGALTKNWDQALLIYCFIASIVPMWLLLQPRGVIGATFLYATLIFGVIGTLVGGWSAGSLSINFDRAFYGFSGVAGNSALFPILFITIACGACSGFHSIVASGTTCKQVRTEKDVKPIAYGAMLLEAMVAIFALSCVMVLASEVKVTARDANAVYAKGIGNFMHLCGIPMNFAISFGLLAFSSFVFDTMDVCTRLGRYVLQEMTGLKGMAGGVIATLVTLIGPGIYLWKMPTGSFMTFWTIFGTSNQLLAALTLVGVSVWLWRTGRPVWFALLPAIFMIVSTGTALVMNFMKFLKDYDLAPTPMILTNMCIAAVLFFLGGLVVFEALRVWNRARIDKLAGLPMQPVG
jgi:carbon starvation protein